MELQAAAGGISEKKSKKWVLEKLLIKRDLGDLYGYCFSFCLECLLIVWEDPMRNNMNQNDKCPCLELAGL